MVRVPTRFAHVSGIEGLKRLAEPQPVEAMLFTPQAACSIDRGTSWREAARMRECSPMSPDAGFPLPGCCLRLGDVAPVGLQRDVGRLGAATHSCVEVVDRGELVAA